MRIRSELFAYALCALFLVAGCGGEPEEVLARGTPREALVEYNGAMRALDKQRARSWILPGDLQTQFFELQFVIAQSIQRFQSAVSERFGEEGLERVMTSPGGQQLVLAAFLSDAEIAALKFHQQGDVAVATFAGGDALRLERHGGQWRVDVVGSSVPAEIEAGLRQLDFRREALASVLDRAASEAARPGTTLESFEEFVDRELERAFAEQPEAAGSPPR